MDQDIRIILKNKIKLNSILLFGINLGNNCKFGENCDDSAKSPWIWYYRIKVEPVRNEKSIQNFNTLCAKNVWNLPPFTFH